MNDCQPTYRRASLTDLPRISEVGQLLNDLHHTAWPAIFAPASAPQRDETHWRQSLDAESAAAFVAEAQGDLLGFVTLQVVDEHHTLLQPLRFARLGSVCVVQTARGRGIGRALMAQAEAWAQSQGAVDVRLTVWAFNHSAQNLYEELGYEPRSLNMGKFLVTPQSECEPTHDGHPLNPRTA